MWKIRKQISWERVGDCMIETAHAVGSHGYPMAHVNKSKMTIARVILMRRYGDVGPNIVSRHICDERRCVNPDHIIPGTRADNSRDMAQRGRSTQGEKNLHCKLTSSQILTIRSDNRLNRVIATDYGISSSHVSEIKNKKTWKHI